MGSATTRGMLRGVILGALVAGLQYLKVLPGFNPVLCVGGGVLICMASELAFGRKDSDKDDA